ncbi:hypothetical protein BGZ63DRAFT_181792 [Mariannaea sp. PMI_226]|nr:hypothetical protein BGZ63DRAFT_181792 [Mariannaea sp. PMI_226]
MTPGLIPETPSLDSNMFEDLRQMCWKPLRYYVEVFAVGYLWGAGLALYSPTHPTVDIAVIWILLVSGSVTVLAFKPVLKAEKFHIIAILLAFFCLVQGALSYTGLLNHASGKSLMSEIVSRLREFTVMTAGVSTAIILTRPASLERPQQDPILAERPNPLGKDDHIYLNFELKDRSETDQATSRSDNHECISDVDSVAFRHTGPSSEYLGGSHSSEISLSSYGRVNPPFVQDVIRWSKVASPMALVRDQSESA